VTKCYLFRFHKGTTVPFGLEGQAADLEALIISAGSASGIAVEGTRNDGSFRTIRVRCSCTEDVCAFTLKFSGLTDYYRAVSCR
jgi:hypothetical protein